MLAAPVHLSPDMGRPPDRVMASPEVYYTWIPSAALLCVAAATWRRYPRFAAAVGLFVAGLLPYLGLTPFDFQPFSTVAQRYAYLAMLGVAMAVAIVVDRAQDRAPWALPLFGGVVIALAVWTNLQTRYWRDTVTLFTHTLEVRPDSVMAHNILGYLDQQQGRLEGAMAHYDAVFRGEPMNPQANFNAGNIFLSLNRPADALPFYEKAIQQAPPKPAYRDNLGIALVQTGRPDEGLRWFHEALRLDPGDASAHANIGKVLRDRGDYAGAIDEYQKALAIQPDLPAARRGLTAALEMARAAATRPTQ
jgi:tetratricopeptide (TPR) repeat protein